MKIIRFLFGKIKYVFQRINRISNVKKSSHFVRKELIKYHKSSGRRYTQFDNEKYIEFGFNEPDKTIYESKIEINKYHLPTDESSSNENINELNESDDATDKLENEETVIVQTSKNKWLYPDDEFGKMERGRSF